VEDEGRAWLMLMVPMGPWVGRRTHLHLKRPLRLREESMRCGLHTNAARQGR
jgi:hypothetical protein